MISKTLHCVIMFLVEIFVNIVPGRSFLIILQSWTLHFVNNWDYFCFKDPSTWSCLCMVIWWSRRSPVLFLLPMPLTTYFIFLQKNPYFNSKHDHDKHDHDHDHVLTRCFFFIPICSPCSLLCPRPWTWWDKDHLDDDEDYDEAIPAPVFELGEWAPSWQWSSRRSRWRRWWRWYAPLPAPVFEHGQWWQWWLPISRRWIIGMMI